MDPFYYFMAMICASVETLVKLIIYVFLFVFVIKGLPYLVNWLLTF